MHWYRVHRGTGAQVGAAAEFYLRHLLGFRGRVHGLLGDGAEDCLGGGHRSDWRQHLDTVIDNWAGAENGAAERVDLLSELHCGFGPTEN